MKNFITGALFFSSLSLFSMENTTFSLMHVSHSSLVYFIAGAAFGASMGVAGYHILSHNDQAVLPDDNRMKVIEGLGNEDPALVEEARTIKLHRFDPLLDYFNFARVEDFKQDEFLKDIVERNISSENANLLIGYSDKMKDLVCLEEAVENGKLALWAQAARILERKSPASPRPRIPSSYLKAAVK